VDKFEKLNKFWKGKKVLITGNTGFKGAWLSIFLNLLNAKVYGYALKPEKQSLFEILKIKKILKKNIFADIENFDILNNYIEKIKPEIIFHLAAQPLVSTSYDQPLETIKTNIIGTSNLLSSLENKNYIQSVVIITTDKVYKIKNKKIFKETDELGGMDPYSASKVCKEIIVNSYVNSIFKNKKLYNKISTARSGNVIGGGDFAQNRLIPDVIRHIFYNQPLKIRNPNNIRPWQHVIEPIYGYLLLAEKQYKNILNRKNISWNFGPRNKNFLKVNEILYLVKKRLKKKIKINFIKSSFKETETLKLNSNKSKDVLNWISKWDILTSLKKTVELEEAIIKKRNVNKICENQILDYLKE
jgi:CDP-glucose 4,6-dehydratase